MREYGQKDPAVAMPHPDKPGEWLLLSSHKRKLALRRAGINIIKLIAHPPVFGVDRYLLSRELNKHTSETALDNALSWKILLDKGHVSNLDELATTLKLNKSIVSKTMAFLKLPDAALGRIRQHPRQFGPAAGQLLSQLAPLLPENELIDQVEGVIEGKVTVRRLERVLEQHQGGVNTRRTKLNSRQYKLQEEGKEIGVLKDWDDGRVVLEVRIDDQKQRAALVDLLKKQFQEP
jgi:ParB family chromosome partitioning protein